MAARFGNPKHIFKGNLFPAFRVRRAARKLHDIHCIAARSAIGSAGLQRSFTNPHAQPVRSALCNRGKISLAKRAEKQFNAP